MQDHLNTDAVQRERAIYARLQEIAREIVDIAEPIKHQGGDHDYDGPMNTVWREIQRATGQDPEASALDVVTPYRPDTDAVVVSDGTYKRRPLSAQASLAVFAKDDYTCQHCGTRHGLTVDHIVPVVKGGTNHPDNLQTLCGPCNSRKGAR